MSGRAGEGFGVVAFRGWRWVLSVGHQSSYNYSLRNIQGGTAGSTACGSRTAQDTTTTAAAAISQGHFVTRKLHVAGELTSNHLLAIVSTNNQRINPSKERKKEGKTPRLTPCCQLWLNDWALSMPFLLPPKLPLFLLWLKFPFLLPKLPRLPPLWWNCRWRQKGGTR